MKKHLSVLLILPVLAFLLISCDNSNNTHPIDSVGSKWESKEIKMEFSVTEDGIENGYIVDKNGTSINVIVSFDNNNKIHVKYADKEDLIFIGECDFEKDAFKVSITDSFGSDFEHVPILLTFKKTK